MTLSDVLHYLAGTSWSFAYVALGVAFACAMHGQRRFVRPLLITALVLAFAVFPLAEFSARTQPAAVGASQ